ncbi:MAG: Uma2 family endonuclease [Gammaproteobacteria bacterium]|nr:Uma2 family endonuclease [Gammaproteobacteria bacterium]
MSTLEKIVLITPQEYLEGEQYSDVRHEYVAGHVYAMVGASRAHNLIAGNFHATLHPHLRGKPCRVFISDMKVHLADAFYYPDVMVACDSADRHDYYCERPQLIVEVISPSTEARDALEKRVAYQSLESLHEYLLVAQDKMEVRIYRRANEDWELETCTENDHVRLTSVGLEIPIEQVYEDVWS